jgi:hypothetical protein
MSAADISPSRWLYVIGILIIAGGVAYSLAIFFSVISGLGSGQQFLAPGSSELLLTEGGEYTIFYESQTTYQGKLFITGESLPLLSIEIENKTTGSKASVYSTSKTTYNINGRAGESICAFRIDHPGIFMINTSYNNAGKGQEVVLAVSRGFTADMSEAWSNAMLYLGSITLGMAVILVTFFIRQRQFKKIEDEKKKMRDF